MKNQSFSPSSLARCLYPSDFFYDNRLVGDQYRKRVIQEALKTADDLFAGGISLLPVSVGNKTGYSLSKLTDKLVLRRCVENIAFCSNSQFKHRNIIAKELGSYLQEGTPYRIYRLDIKSFFESVDLDTVKHALETQVDLSIHTQKLVLSFLEIFTSRFGPGLPRGVEMSPILADLVLTNFDNTTSNQNEVFYYSRFVDDIIMVTSSIESLKSFSRSLQETLPGNLLFNYNKRKVIEVGRREKSTTVSTSALVADFDFLGYSFQVVDTKTKKEKQEPRKVTIDIGAKKIKQLKTKIAKSFMSYLSSGDFVLLIDRLTFLTTNRDLKQKGSSKVIPTGIYYNYSVIDGDSKKLNELDIFLRNSVLSSSSRHGQMIRAALDRYQKNQILKLSFVKGFNKRIYKRYSPNRLKEITKIWQ